LPKYKGLTKKNIKFSKKKRFVERWNFNQNRNSTFWSDSMKVRVEKKTAPKNNS
jgi:hypothetical protein